MDAGARGRAIKEADWRAICDWLDSLATEEDLGEARQWWRAEGQRAVDLAALEDGDGFTHAIRRALAFVLAEDAAEAWREIDKAEFGWLWHDRDGVMTRVANLLIRRGETFCAEFMERANAVHSSGKQRFSAEEPAALTTAVVSCFDTELPDGPTYPLGWVQLVANARSLHDDMGPEDYRPIAVFVSDGAAGVRPAYGPASATTLVTVLRPSPHLTQTLTRALAIPNGLKEWSDLRSGDWSLTDAARELIAAGDLDRGPIIDAVLVALTRTDTPGCQGVYARLLSACDLTPAETKARVDLLVGVMPVVHGSVSKVLVELVLAADLAEEDLEAVGSILLARPEKAQKQRLLTQLAKRPDSPTRSRLLSLAADSDDAAFAEAARQLLAPDGAGDATTMMEPPSVTGVWQVDAEGYDIPPFVPVPPTEAGLDALLSHAAISRDVNREASALDLLVRWGANDLDGLRQLLRSEGDPDQFSGLTAFKAAWLWSTTGSGEISYAFHYDDYELLDSGDEVAIERVINDPPPAVLRFADLLATETAERLGSVVELLSTPSHIDGSLTMSALTERVAAARSYGTYDLVQALLRLGPVTLADAHRFEGLSLPPEDDTLDLDGVDIIRGWLNGGGIGGREVTFENGVPSMAPAEVPLPAALLSKPGIEGLLRNFEPAEGAPEFPFFLANSHLAVVPHDAEGFAVLIQRHGDYLDDQTSDLPILIHSPGPTGPAVHHHIAGLLAGSRSDRRLVVAQQISHLIHQQRFDPALFAERCLDLFDHGKVSLARISDGLDQVAQICAVSAVWPAWTALMDRAVAEAKKPAGLADLFRTAKVYATLAAQHLGSSAIPDSVRAFAAARSSTKAAIEARALVAAVDAAQPSAEEGEKDE